MTPERPVLVVATRNPGKVREFARLLTGVEARVIGLDEAGFHGDIDEPFNDYAGNARHKAEVVCAATQHAVLADDSGIEALGLDGWPGPLSARWMGPDADDRDRLQGLLDAVAARSPDDRRARYVAALALARPARPTVLARGECSGTLVDPEGDGGFGYDPAFLSDDLGVTFGLAGESEKDRVSHRARALNALVDSGELTDL